MGQRTLPPPRLATLPPATTPDLKAQFDASQKAHGLRTGIPLLIIRRDPNLTRAFTQMSAALPLLTARRCDAGKNLR